MALARVIAKYFDSLINEAENACGEIELTRFSMFSSFKNFCDDKTVRLPDITQVLEGPDANQVISNSKFVQSITVSKSQEVGSVLTSNWIIKFKKIQNQTLDQQIANAVFTCNTYVEAGQLLVSQQVIPCNYSRFEFLLRFQRILTDSMKHFNTLARNAIDAVRDSRSDVAHFEYKNTSDATILLPLNVLSTRFKFSNIGNRFTVRNCDFQPSDVHKDWNMSYEYVFNPTIAVGNVNINLPFYVESATGHRGISTRFRHGVLSFQVRLPGQKKGNWIGRYFNLLDARNSLCSALALNSESRNSHDTSDTSSVHGFEDNPNEDAQYGDEDTTNITPPALLIGQQIRVYDKVHGLCTGKVMNIDNSVKYSFRAFVSTGTNHWECDFTSENFKIRWDIYDHSSRDTRKRPRKNYQLDSDNELDDAGKVPYTGKASLQQFSPTQQATTQQATTTKTYASGRDKHTRRAQNTQRVRVGPARRALGRATAPNMATRRTKFGLIWA